MTDKRETAARAMFAVLNPGEDWDVWVKMDNPGIRSAVNHAVKLGDRLLAWLAEHDREVRFAALEEAAQVVCEFAFTEFAQGAKTRARILNRIRTRAVSDDAVPGGA